MSPRTFSLRFFSILAAVSLAAAAPSAQQKPGGGPTKIIVRAWANGEPVADLKPADLTIRVDGKQREVRSLDVVKAPAADAAAPAAAPAAAAAAPKPSAIPAPFATNKGGTTAAAAPAAPGAREFLVILDDESIAPGQEEPVRKAVAKLMAEASPADRFGVVSLRMGGASVAPTADRQATTDSLGKFAGGGSTSEKSADMTCRAQRAIGSLGAIFKQSPAGRTLVLISPGISANMDNSARMMGTSVTSNDTAQTCIIRTNDMEELGNAANGSPANMYILYYSEGLAARALTSSAQSGLENIAGVTGAEYIRIVGGTEAGISRIPKETSVYYVATLDEAAAGQIRRVDARVGRDGVKVIARPAGAGAAPAASAAPVSTKNMQPRDMATSPASFSEVPLRAAGFVTRQGADAMKIVTLFEPADPSVKLVSAAVALIDGKGKASLLTLKPEDLQRSPILAPQLITPGTYRVRVAAKTADGAGGTVDFDVTGSLQDAAPLKFGAMMLGITDAAGFAPKLQFTGTDKLAVGVMEIYGVPSGANVTAEFEILEADGSERGRAAGNVGKGPGEDARMVFGGFDISTLEPADYTLRIKVNVDGKPAGTVQRTLRKVAAF